MAFVTVRDRDAWATIRGFVYQVDMTIIRWLDLDADEKLELERGEDIDFVGGEFRSLEQIKVRENKITLRSKEANEAMASFYEHRVANPTQKLVFRFVTNALVGKEKFPWSMEEKAIVVWNNIRQKKLNEEELWSSITKIRQFLLGIERPKKFNVETWKQWKEYLKKSNDNELHHFICSFEWGVHNPEPEDLKITIEKKLVEQGYVSDTSGAKNFSESLFCYIFRLLSGRGLKTLCKDDLYEVLSEFEINDVEKSILQFIEILIQQHESRISAIEEKVSQTAVGKLIWNVPHRANPHFIERGNDLEMLREKLNSGQLTAVTQTLAGLGGIGKTQMAVQYAYKYRKEYNIIWWIDAEHEESIRADFSQLAKKLSDDKDIESDEVEFVREWLSRNDKWLLLFDNAIDYKEIESYLPSPQEGHILITSRNQDWPIHPLVLSEFNRRQSIEFLMRRTNCSDATQEQDASDLAAELGFLPLALEHAGAYIRRKRKSFKEYLDLYTSKKVELLAVEGIPDSYHSTILTTWNISIESIKQESSLAEKWLDLFAYLGADQIPYSWFYDIEDSVDILEKDKAIEVLSKYSLVNINVDEHHASMHRLVQEVIRNKIGEYADEVLQRSVHVVSKDFSFDQYNYDSWVKCGKILSHAINVAKHILDLRVKNGNAISILLNLGLFFNHYSKYSTAQDYLLAAKDICESMVPVNTNWKSSILNALSVISLNRNKPEEAIEYIQTALSLTTEIDKKRATILSNLAVQKMNVEKNYEEALRLFIEALRIEHLIYQSDNADTAVTRNNIAECLAKLGRYPEAKVQHEITINIERSIAKETGSLNPNLATRLSNYGGTLFKMGKAKDAIPYYIEALEILEEAFPGDDYRKAYVMTEYGGALLKTGDAPGAFKLIDESYSMLLNTEKRNDPQTKEIELLRSFLLSLLK
ncbi:FxSxx-COOH system tetratricopeptide repeat protein [Paenibacillus turpanensis]|uniref:FxSxx-COOH system tetratricopeptide repeat protein n=1 Tax=Paenibacillus turpanensis TaxID=2689078 RepID=UPI0014079944|nr:FxSxx-COOH system tetratricopeptide repeat protein [Paenibacillus turpanensis]